VTRGHVPPGSKVLIESEVEDLEQELRAVQRKVRRHFVWTFLGLSPAALIPAIGLFREGSFGLLILLVVLVTISQGYLGGKAARKASRLKKALNRRREEE